VTAPDIARISDQAHALDHPQELEALRVGVLAGWRGEHAATLAAKVTEEGMAQLLETN
jgi:hypothetical protein